MKKPTNLSSNQFIQNKFTTIRAYFKNLSLKRKKTAELEKLDYAEYLLEKKQFKWDGFKKPLILFIQEIAKIRWFKKTLLHFWHLIFFLATSSACIWLINYCIYNLLQSGGVFK